MLNRTCGLSQHDFKNLLPLFEENDTLGAFRTETDSGYLEANIVYISKSEQVVNVFFKARHSEAYAAKLIVKIEPFSMMRPLVVDLRGAGTYDQKAEAVFNI